MIRELLENVKIKNSNNTQIMLGANVQEEVGLWCLCSTTKFDPEVSLQWTVLLQVISMVIKVR